MVKAFHKTIITALHDGTFQILQLDILYPWHSYSYLAPRLFFQKNLDGKKWENFQ